jgi:hypothetical protein
MKHSGTVNGPMEFTRGMYAQCCQITSKTSNIGLFIAQASRGVTISSNGPKNGKKPPNDAAGGGSIGKAELLLLILRSSRLKATWPIIILQLNMFNCGTHIQQSTTVLADSRPHPLFGYPPMTPLELSTSSH